MDIGSKNEELNGRSYPLWMAIIGIGIGVAVAIAVAIGCMGLQKPIATAIATPIPIPTPMDIVFSFVFDAAKCQPTYELINNFKRVQDSKAPCMPAWRF